MRFAIEEIKDINELSVDERNKYFEKSANTFEQTYPWYECIKNVLASEKNIIKYALLFDTVSHESKLLAPLYTVREGIFPFQTESISALSNYYTAFYEPHLTEQSGTYAYQFAKLLAAKTKKLKRIDMNPMNPGSDVFDGLVKGFRSAGLYVETYFRFGNWYLKVNGRKFDDYYQTVPSRLRSTISRKERKLNRQFSVTKKIIEKKGDIQHVLDGYEQIYAKSWKVNEPYREFIREVVSKFAEKGWLRLGILYADDKPAAAQIWFVYNNIASIFKLAYDPLYAKYSVGSILTKELMSHVIDIDKVDIVDYLCGDDNYKKDWMSNRRERWGIRAYKKSVINNWYPIFKSYVKKTYQQTKSEA